MSQKVIIVTGASRGIGLAISTFLLQAPQSCNVVVVARSKKPLEQLKSQYNDQVQILTGDAGNFSLGKEATDLAISTWGRLDGLVVNHGRVEPIERVADANIDEWRAAFDVNVFSAVAMVKAAIPELRSTKGRIVFTSSGAAVKGTSTWGCYGAGKAVLNHLALTLEKEEPDITTVSIRPGVVATQMQDTLRDVHFKTMEKEDTERFKKLRQDGKMLKPEDPGHVMARIVLNAPKDLSGGFYNWNDEKLASFQS